MYCLLILSLNYIRENEIFQDFLQVEIILKITKKHPKEHSEHPIVTYQTIHSVFVRNKAGSQDPKL